MFALITENNKVEKYPVDFYDLQQRFPNTSFIVPLRADDLHDFGVVEVNSTPAPTIDYKTQKVLEVDPTFVDGTWVQTWVIEELTPEEKQQILDAQIAKVRSERNTRLAACDWTQLPDAPVDAAAWAIYRQELRDVTAQPGFPWDVQWPQKPQ